MLGIYFKIFFDVVYFRTDIIVIYVGSFIRRFE